MEYHRDRFEDYSLLIFNEKEKLIALLPANILNNTLYSHQGLTYGGFILDDKLKLTVFLELYQTVLKYLEAQKIKTLIAKIIPSIYHKKPSEELLYALFLSNATLLRRDTLSVIENNNFKLSKDRKAGLKRGNTFGLIVKEVKDFSEFFNEILIPNLANKHNAKPVHSVEEITCLKSKFPKNIRQFNVYYKDKIVGGTTIFESDNVAHSQYLSGNDQKNELGSLDFLYNYLLTEIFQNKKYLDFGISNEYNGAKVNAGLSYWKESFGAYCLVHDFYEVQTANYVLLENVLI